jgi:hypothetical protein
MLPFGALLNLLAESSHRGLCEYGNHMLVFSLVLSVQLKIVVDPATVMKRYALYAFIFHVTFDM